MKRLIATVAVASLVTTGSLVTAGPHHVRADLVPIDHSGVTGFADLTQRPGGGATLHVHVKGLRPGSSYASFYYESTDCSAPADLLTSFTADANGSMLLKSEIDEDVDEVGSVSIRVGPDYGTLLACATMH